MRRNQLRELDLTVPGNLEILNMASRKKRKKKKNLSRGPEENSAEEEEYESEDEDVKEFLAVLRRPKPPPRNAKFGSRRHKPVKRSFMFSLLERR